MLKTICKVEGLQYYDTLTGEFRADIDIQQIVGSNSFLFLGFKWLGNRAMELRAAGTPVIFSYEEALGYCVGDVLCDKDGVSGASIFLEMASALANGWTEEFGESGESKKSPDRVDALVHALTALLIKPPPGFVGGTITAKSLASRRMPSFRGGAGGGRKSY
jgi:hypothetical protein